MLFAPGATWSCSDSDPPLTRHLLRNGFVIGRRGNDGDVLKILGCRTHHRRAADVDVFDHVLELDAGFRGGLLERVEIHHHHVDGLNAVLLHRGDMLFILTDVQNAAVHLGMKRLDSAIEHFRKAGKLRNVLDRDTGIAQQLGRASG